MLTADVHANRPVDVFVTYDGKRAADLAVSRYAVRHLVAAEVSPQLYAHAFRHGCRTDERDLLLVSAIRLTPRSLHVMRRAWRAPRARQTRSSQGKPRSGVPGRA